MKKVTIKNLGEILSVELDTSMKNAKKYLDFYFEQIKNSLLEQDRVIIRDFGVFTCKKMNSHIRVCPSTKINIFINERLGIRWRSSKLLKEKVNKV